MKTGMIALITSGMIFLAWVSGALGQTTTVSPSPTVRTTVTPTPTTGVTVPGGAPATGMGGN